MKLLTGQINLVELWSGHDFAMGKNREGNVKRLAELGQEFNYTVHTFTPVVVNGQVVSSTQIRQLLLAGEVRQAAQLLGRYPSISGHVVTGAKRGRTLGFPRLPGSSSGATLAGARRLRHLCGPRRRKYPPGRRDQYWRAPQF